MENIKILNNCFANQSHLTKMNIWVLDTSKELPEQILKQIDKKTVNLIIANNVEVYDFNLLKTADDCLLIPVFKLEDVIEYLILKKT